MHVLSLTVTALLASLNDVFARTTKCPYPTGAVKLLAKTSTIIVPSASEEDKAPRGFPIGCVNLGFVIQLWTNKTEPSSLMASMTWIAKEKMGTATPHIKMFPVGMLETNCVIALCPETREAIVFDPGGDAPRIIAAIEQLNAKVKYIIDTHGHPDHVLANQQVKERTGAKLGIHPLDAPMLRSAGPELTFWMTEPYQPATPDFYLNEGDKIEMGKVSFDVLHTPGHTPGHISLVTDEIAIVGDVLFFQGIGRTDFPGGSFQQLVQSIRTKLFTLSDSTKVYPGHGPATTIGDEKEYNPFVGRHAYL